MFTFIKKYKTHLIFLSLATITYLLFFSKMLNPNLILYSGKDTVAFHYPSRNFLSESLHNGTFPFYTHRMFSGFPIFLDLERQYLNPINILTTYTAGPELSVKIMHFATYLVGSLGLYLFLKSYEHKLSGILAANLIYFFSFFMLFHQQHFGIVQILTLLPLLLYLTKIKHKTSGLLLGYMFYLGSFQALLLVLLTQLIYTFSTKISWKFYIKQLIFFGLLIIPVIYPLIQLYLGSYRATGSVAGQGLFSPLMSLNFFIPFLYQQGENYMGVLISNDFLMQETYIYGGVSVFIAALFGFANLSDKKTKNFLSILFWAFIILTFVNLPFPPFSLFRYWPRSSILLILVCTFLTSHLISAPKAKFNIKNFSFVVYPVLFLSFVELIKYFILRDQTSLSMVHLFMRNDYVLDKNLWLIPVLAFVTLISILHKNLTTAVITIIIYVDLVFFGTLALDSAFASKNILIPTEINGDTALYYNQQTMLGYSVYAPKDVVTNLKNLGFSNTRYFPNDFTQYDLVVTDLPDDNFYDPKMFYYGVILSATGLILYILKK